jgi:uncharacterized protein YdeI (YjbR/CyaY-like superfamily)
MDEQRPAGDEMNPIFFASPTEFVSWLEAHHGEESELWVGYHKKATGRPSMTWPEAVDAALCFGWIDGIRKSVDAERYKNRFTPRRKGSNWSAVNVKRVQELIAQGQVRPAGMAAWKAAIESKTAFYSYEQRHDAELGEEFAAQFQANVAAWEYFQSRAPWYRNAAIGWVIGAKKDETKRRRLQTLITDSAAGRTVSPLTRRTASS